MLRATAVAHSNLAFVKYWGKVDHTLNIPTNNSISMTLSDAKTTTTVEFDASLAADEIEIGGVMTSGDARISKHLDRIRAMAGSDLFAHVQTRNTFPSSAGFASSASGFAALSLAGASAIGLTLPDKELSMLARQGSGSACRSIHAGFVEWLHGSSHETSYAVQVAPPEHWDLVDIAVVVSAEAKEISSSTGHKLAENSLFWSERLRGMPALVDTVRGAILNRDFETFGRHMEAEALSMHAVALTSPHGNGNAWKSGIYYWAPDTLLLMTAVQNWRADNLPVYFTLDAGPTVHLITTSGHAAGVIAAVEHIQQEKDWRIFVSRPAPGAHIIKNEDSR